MFCHLEALAVTQPHAIKISADIEQPMQERLIIEINRLALNEGEAPHKYLTNADTRVGTAKLVPNGLSN